MPKSNQCYTAFMTLKNLLSSIEHKHVSGDLDIGILSIHSDSESVTPGGLFAAVRGTKKDGHDFIADAVYRGAIAIVCEDIPNEITNGVTYVRVESAGQALGNIASTWYGDPSHNMKVVGVTGTNGKTTTATLLYRLFRSMGYKVGLVSTIVNYINDQEVPATHTTPSAIELQKIFGDMVEVGCEYCFMEVSSHALEQGRVAGVEFTGAVFTNITHDHLDYHGTFEAYMMAKRKFFDMLHPHAWAIANMDDENGEFMLQNTKAAPHYYSFNQQEDGVFAGRLSFEGKVLENGFDGLRLDINGTVIATKLIGTFNAYNIAAIFGAARMLDMDADIIAEHIAKLDPAPGRFDVMTIGNRVGIVDYAHTPDALENVLKTIGAIKTNEQKIITVFGCGGDRDHAKRPIMARIANELSDYIIMTADNPRNEEPLAIIEGMKQGIDSPDATRIFEIPDRTEAIDTAVYTARPGDIVLVAGKGHEDYQIIGEEKLHFDDKEVLREKLRHYA